MGIWIPHKQEGDAFGIIPNSYMRCKPKNWLIKKIHYITRMMCIVRPLLHLHKSYTLAKDKTFSITPLATEHEGDNTISEVTSNKQRNTQSYVLRICATHYESYEKFARWGCVHVWGNKSCQYYVIVALNMEILKIGTLTTVNIRS